MYNLAAQENLSSGFLIRSDKKLSYTATEDGYRLEISDLKRRGIELSM